MKSDGVICRESNHQSSETLSSNDVEPGSPIRERRHWFKRGEKIWDVSETFTDWLRGYPYGEKAKLNSFGNGDSVKEKLSGTCHQYNNF